MFEYWQWPNEQSRRLLDVMRGRRGSHAYLITGAEGVGKRTAARLYAGALLCSAEETLRPCGMCGECLRLYGGTHPDAHVIAPGDNRSNTISIDTVREAAAALASRSFEGGVKVAMILSAGRMEDRAQNTLLKTLEEPPGDCVFFLTAECASELLPTIRSRCAWLPLPALPVEQAERVLVSYGLSAHDAREAASFSHGAVGAALRYPDEIRPLRQQIDRILGMLRYADDAQQCAAEMAAIADSGPDQNRVKRISLLFDILEHTVSSDIGKAPELLDAAGGDSDSMNEKLRRASVRTRLAMLDAAVDARRRVSMHMSLAATIEMMLLNWMRGNP